MVRIVAAYRAERLGARPPSERFAPASRRLAAAAALLLGVLAGWAAARVPSRAAEGDGGWPEVPAPVATEPSLADLYLEWLDDPDAWSAPEEGTAPAAGVEPDGPEGRG